MPAATVCRLSVHIGQLICGKAASVENIKSSARAVFGIYAPKGRHIFRVQKKTYNPSLVGVALRSVVQTKKVMLDIETYFFYLVWLFFCVSHFFLAFTSLSFEMRRQKNLLFKTSRKRFAICKQI